MGDRSDVRSSRPRVRQRERVLRLVREHGGAIDATEVAARLRVHVSTARFHLDGLCGEGLVERTRLARAGVGRPRTGYRAAQGLDYSVLAGVLAVGLGQTAQTRAHRAQRAGREWARRLADSMTAVLSGDVDAYLEQRTRTTLDLFRRLGFAPALADPAGDDPPSERVIRLTACPVRNLARSHPESVCGVHLGLLQGVVGDAAPAGRRAIGRPSVSARLEPFVEPELCIARLMTQR